METYSKYFNEIEINDIPQIGGKMLPLRNVPKLIGQRYCTPDGFALTAKAPQKLVANNFSLAPVLEDGRLWVLRISRMSTNRLR